MLTAGLTVGVSEESVAQAAYEDQVIEGLAPEVADEEPMVAYDETGWPRYLRLEGRLSNGPFDDTGGTAFGVGIYGLLETPNHGTLSVDGQFTPRSGTGTITVRQRGLPLANGWIAQHEAGVITTSTAREGRLTSRVQLPSALLQGVGGEWSHDASGWLWQLSHGQPGRLELLPQANFDPLPGSRTTAGVQWRLPGADAASSPWTLGLQHHRARGVRDFLASSALAVVDADATRLSLRHDDGALRWQVQGLSSRAGAHRPPTQAVWVDSDWTAGNWTHRAGAYRLDPGLQWAALPMASNLQGVYIDSQYSLPRWSVNGTVDLLRSVDGQQAGGYFATVNTSRRLSARSSWQGGLAVRNLQSMDWNAFSDWRTNPTWGASSLRLEVEGGDNRPRAVRLSQDQAWSRLVDWDVSTTIGMEWIGSRNGAESDRITFGALSVNLPIGQRGGLRGTADFSRSTSGQTREGINLAGNWRLNSRWSVDAGWLWSTGRARQTFILDPLAPPVLFEQTLSNRSFFVALRYELQAGSRSVPLGGKAAQGGGSVEGVVFFDDNRNGTQEANEAGVPNATVLLNDRYPVRTDNQGRFTFPLVAPGAQTLRVLDETLPLPWTTDRTTPPVVEVQVRGSHRLSIPVRRSE
jgi:hypothetical protein